MSRSRQGFGLVVLVCFVFGAPSTRSLSAQAPQLYVDSAPNAYGNDDFDRWWSGAQTAVASGDFTNLAYGTFPDSKRIDPIDEIVYSTGDLGHRLHWLVWLPDWSPPLLPETGAPDVDGRLEVKVLTDWNGELWTWDWEEMELVLDAHERGWITPETVVYYDEGPHSGVIATFGFAWWAYDDLAPPYDTPDTSPFDETDEADVAAMSEMVRESQTMARGIVRWVDEDGVTETFQLEVIVSRCGDGEVDEDEVCDDGSNNGGHGYCNLDCSGLGPHCGDGIINGFEDCDDANDDDDDSCPSTCLFAYCGDGFVYAGVEECDDGNPIDDDACSNACLARGGGTQQPEACPPERPDCQAGPRQVQEEGCGCRSTSTPHATHRPNAPATLTLVGLLLGALIRRRRSSRPSRG